MPLTTSFHVNYWCLRTFFLSLTPELGPCITVIQRGILKHEYKNCANQELQTYCFGNRIYNKSWKTIVLFSVFRYKSIDDSDLSLLIGSFTVQSLRYIT